AGSQAPAGPPQALRCFGPALAAVGGLVNTVLEGGGVERTAPFGAFRVDDHRGDRLAGKAAGGVIPGHTEVGTHADASAGPGGVVSAGDHVAVRNVVQVGEGPPDQSPRFGVEGELVGGVPQGAASLPVPGLTRVGRPGKPDVSVGDVVPVWLERVEVIVPHRG